MRPLYGLDRTFSIAAAQQGAQQTFEDPLLGPRQVHTPVIVNSKARLAAAGQHISRG